jgi:mannose-1-phosphate guanylyltransferase/phosphomannomutase
MLDGDTLLHLTATLWCAADKGDRSVAIPMSASWVVEKIAEEHGHSVVRTGVATRDVASAARSKSVGLALSRQGGVMVPEFLAAFDAVAGVGALSRLVAIDGRSLDEIVGGLPEFHLETRSVACPFSLKGTVMRRVMEYAEGAGLPIELTDGVRVMYSDGWALVLPDSSEPVVHIYSEGPSKKGADEVAQAYVLLVEEVASPE